MNKWVTLRSTAVVNSVFTVEGLEKILNTWLSFSVRLSLI